jgi:hypothetical protein
MRAVTTQPDAPSSRAVSSIAPSLVGVWCDDEQTTGGVVVEHAHQEVVQGPSGFTPRSTITPGWPTAWPMSTGSTTGFVRRARHLARDQACMPGSSGAAARSAEES